MQNLKELENLGFEKVGKWTKNKDKDGIEVSWIKEEYKKKRTIYAFVTHNNETEKSEVVYIGICEAPYTKLGKRLNGYKKPGKKQLTNKRINEEIYKVLNNNSYVDIYAFEPHEKHQIKIYGIKVDLVKGLENPLIRKFKPKWNKQGKKRK